MIDEQLFGQRLADWLAGGPLEAPPEPLAAAIAHARAHPQRESRIVGLWRAAMTHVNVTEVQPRPPHRLGFAAIAVAVGLVIAIGAGGAYLVANRPTNGVVPVAAPTSSSVPSTLPSGGPPSASPAALAPSASPTARPSGVREPVVHVTSYYGYGGHGPGSMCTGHFCRFSVGVTASDDRLSGNYYLWPTGTTMAGTWGTITVCRDDCGIPWIGGPSNNTTIPEDRIAWEGEWFTAGARPTRIGETDPATSPDFMPVDTVWLRGHGENEGLSAVVRIDTSQALDGWIFPTP